MADHTNAPWKSEGPDQFGDYNIVNGEAKLAIAAVVSNLRPAAEVAANARLVAAAPSLASALRECLTTLIFDERIKNPAFDPRTQPTDSPIGMAVAALQEAGR